MMKSVLVACLLWFCTTGAHAMGTDSVVWRWSPYVSAGVGTPNGMRTEVGMHIAGYGSLYVPMCTR